jgi:hypothetical protein
MGRAKQRLSRFMRRLFGGTHPVNEREHLKVEGIVRPGSTKIEPPPEDPPP